MPLRDTLTPFGRKRAQDVGDGGARRPKVFWLGGRRHGLGHTREGIAQSILFRMIEGGPQNLAANALRSSSTLSVVSLRISKTVPHCRAASSPQLPS